MRMKLLGLGGLGVFGVLVLQPQLFLVKGVAQLLLVQVGLLLGLYRSF